MLKPSHSKRCRDCRAFPNRAKRLECGAFTAAFIPQKRQILLSGCVSPLARLGLFRDCPATNMSALTGFALRLPALATLP